MPPETKQTSHPYIVKAPGLCGGAATIRGTRVSVWVLATYARAGYEANVIRTFFPYLTLAQIYDALSYWQDHPAEIEESVLRNAPSESPDILVPR